MSLIDELFEDRENDEKIIKSFHTKDTLPESIFNKEGQHYKLKEDIRKKLLEIVDDFLDYVKIDFFIYDVVLTGSLANYNWSNYSDVDLHIIIDFSEFDAGKIDNKFYKTIVKEFFDSKKLIWNTNTDIKIKGFDVEIYVQDIVESHLSSGVYSILNNEWVVEPEKLVDKIDERKILEKSEYFAKLIDNLVKKSKEGIDVTKQVDELKEKIKKFRKSGLESGGELSYENLTFKLLRRNDYIEKLLNIKIDIRNKKLSVTQ